MEIQEIEVTIDKNGQVKVHVRGAKGKKCLDLTKELELALGAQLAAREMTAEALEAETGSALDQTVETKN